MDNEQQVDEQPVEEPQIRLPGSDEIITPSGLYPGEELAHAFERDEKLMARVRADTPNVVIHQCEHIERHELPAAWFLYLGLDKRLMICAICARYVSNTISTERRYADARLIALADSTKNLAEKMIAGLEQLEKNIHRHWWQR